MARWISLSEFGREQKVTTSAVRYRILNGTISKDCVRFEDGKMVAIDAEAAQKEWVLKGRVSQSETHLAKKGITSLSNPAPTSAKPFTESTETIGGNEVPVQTANFHSDTDRLFKARTSTEELKSRKLELEIQEREGRLLPADEVQKRITQLIIETKEVLLNIPAKVGPVLLGCTDLVELEVMLTKEINAALENLSRLNR